MIVVNGVVQSDPESIAAMKDAIAKMEQTSRAEPGCDEYTFSVELNDPNTIRITERWKSMDALKEHFASPHMAEFQQAMGAHPPKGMTVTAYEATEVPMP